MTRNTRQNKNKSVGSTRNSIYRLLSAEELRSVAGGDPKGGIVLESPQAPPDDRD